MQNNRSDGTDEDLTASIDAVARTTLVYLAPSVLTHETLAKGFVLQTSPALGSSSVARLGVPFGDQSWGLWWASTQCHFCVAFNFPLERTEGGGRKEAD